MHNEHTTRDRLWWIYFGYNKNDEGYYALGAVFAQDATEVVEQATQWALQRGEGFYEFGVDRGIPVPFMVGSEEYEALATGQDIQHAVEQVLRSGKSQFLVLGRLPYKILSLPPVCSVQSLEEAMEYLKEVGLPATPIPELKPKRFRRQWQSIYVEPIYQKLRQIQSRPGRHICLACDRRASQRDYIWIRYDWDFFHKVAQPRPAWSEIVRPDETIALFFERCDLPIFAVQGEVLRDFEFSVQTDLYLTPLSDMRWTVSYDHEYFGPFYVEPTDVQRYCDEWDKPK